MLLVLIFTAAAKPHWSSTKAIHCSKDVKLRFKPSQGVYSHKEEWKGSRKKVNPFDNNQRLVTNEKDMNNNTRLELPLIGNTNL